MHHAHAVEVMYIHMAQAKNGTQLTLTHDASFKNFHFYLQLELFVQIIPTHFWGSVHQYVI